MKNSILYLSFCAAFIYNQLNAQRACSVLKTNHINHTQAVPISHIVLMNKYDMKFQHLNLNMERTGKSVSGSVRSIAQVKSLSLDTFGIELYSGLTIDSVRINGSLVSPIRNSHALSLVLPNTLQQNEMIDAIIYYRGTAPTLNGSAIGDGLNNGTSQSWGNQVTWSLSEPYSAYEWFPCKQQLQDKLDSVYVYVTTDAANKVGSNGILTAVVDLGAKKRYEWKSKYVIDYYLISVAIAKYVDYSFYAHPAGTTDSILIQNYIYDNPATLTNFKSVIDQTDDLIEFFSDKFGLYPFANEKYGHAMAPFGGGMEHQTMTSLGSFNFELVAHELGHQWWGDHVTCSTWSDIFINEGFASYCEHLALEQFNPSNAASTMLQVHTNVMSQTGGSVYNPDTVTVNRIFSSRLSYDKGSAIIHSLRFIINDDNLFFTALKNFQQQFSYNTASILSFKSSVENTTGLDLTQFFNQWIYGEGYPTFTVKWNQVGNNFYLKNTETVSMSSVTPLFITPIEFKLSRSNGDTIIKVYQDALVKDYSFTINGTISNVTTDPNNWILNKGTVTRDANLVSLNELNENHFISVYPNPAKDNLIVNNTINANATQFHYIIHDVSGKLILNGTTQQLIEIEVLTDGMYFLIINDENGNLLKVTKFIKSTY